MRDEPPSDWWHGPSRPSGLWRRRRMWLIVIATLTVGAMALAASPAARNTARSLVVTGWRLPVGTSPATPQAGPSGTAEQAEKSPAPTLHWTPPPGASWQWQPTGEVNLDHPVDVYDLPLETTTPAAVAEIHNRGTRALCWLQVGIVDTTSRHHAKVGPALLGATVTGHPDERYLDVRNRAGLRSFIGAQLDECWAKGFDGVDAAAIDTYLAGVQTVGFPIELSDSVELTRSVVGLAHARGLAVGLHLTGASGTRDALLDADAFLSAIEPITDFAVADRCVAAGMSCSPFTRYTQHNKAILHVEYLADYPGSTPTTPQPALDRFCPTVKSLGFSSILKDGSDANPSWALPCP
jgi:hypothetical protein